MMQGPSMPFPPQPGMQMQQGHMMGAPGPGHPMQQGMMHPGVSGPGGPVSQAGPMMGMQPGAPNAHALSHLQPQQAHMFQQQQQQQQQQQHPGMMNPGINPTLQMAQHSAQRQAMLQRQHQQMLAQNGMSMPFPQQMGGMNAQTIAALQQQGISQPYVQLPAHLRQQMQQNAMSQQAAQQAATSNPQQAQAIAQAHAAQQAHAQAAAQAQAQAHHQQQQQQQQQQLQAQAIVMQQGQSQQSNHSQSGSQAGPTTTQGQQPGPLRPPSAMSHQGQASPAQQPTPQQQPHPTPQLRQQTPAPNQPPNMPPQPNQQQPTPVQMQQRVHSQGMPPGQVNPAAAQAQQAANAARMAMMRQNQSQNQNQNPSGSSGILKLLNFVDQLGRFSASQADKANQIAFWQAFVERFFSETGAFLHGAYSRAADRTKMFEVVYAALPRYFLSQFSTEVENLQITIDGATETIQGTDSRVIADRAKFIYTYKNQCQVTCRGKLTAFWAGSDKMEWLQFEMQGHQQMIPRDLLETLFSQEEINPLNAQQSPRMNKKTQKAAQQRQPSEPTMPISKLPTAGMTDWGLSPGLFHYLEIYETMNHMTGLITHYLEHPHLSASGAMENWSSLMSNANPNTARMQGVMPPNQGIQQPQQPAARTPSGMGQPGLPPNQFMSPAMQNGLLPNSHMSSPSLMQQNHTPSPASHAMVHQPSQSSNAASVNTSPNVNNKRRRSTAKIDNDDGGGDANGAPKVKPSPRIGGGNKRAKGNN